MEVSAFTGLSKRSAQGPELWLLCLTESYLVENLCLADAATQGSFLCLGGVLGGKEVKSGQEHGAECSSPLFNVAFCQGSRRRVSISGM